MMMRTELALPGLQAKQARSRVTLDRLLASGRQLLDQGAFEATSISDIASAAGCSVGAFYHRFADKEAFFAVLIETVLADIVTHAKEAAADQRFTEGSIETTLTNCVAYWIQAFRRHQGLIRTVMKKTLHAEDTWTPVRQMGQAAFEPFIHCWPQSAANPTACRFNTAHWQGFKSWPVSR